MLKRRVSLGLCVALACVFTLTGCGVELIELTPTERQQIINYSAHVVGEFNTRQTKGYTALSKETLDSIGDKDKQEEESDETQTGDGQSEGGQSQEGGSTGSVGTLTQALGIQGIVADNLSYKVVSEYIQDELVNIVPSNGKSLVLVECTLSNTTSEEIMCDIYGMEMEFSVNINSGAVEAGSIISILDNDLSTMSGKLSAGQTRNMILLFEIPTEIGNSIESITLNVKNASTNHTIFMN